MELHAAVKLANSLMQKHGVSSRGWSFDFDRAINRHGCTHYNTKLITLSRSFVELNTPERVTQTILHECAHALAGHAAGHGAVWKAHARAIGFSNPTRTAAAVMPKAKWIATCPSCGESAKRNRRNAIACAKCCVKYNGGKWSADYLFVFTPNV